MSQVIESPLTLSASWQHLWQMPHYREEACWERGPEQFAMQAAAPGPHITGPDTDKLT